MAGGKNRAGGGKWWLRVSQLKLVELRTTFFQFVDEKVGDDGWNCNGNGERAMQNDRGN